MVGGYNSAKRPFYVQVKVDAPGWEEWERFFGGAIINENYVLTAAHIFDEAVTFNPIIIVSDFMEEESEKRFIVADKVIIHEEYNASDVSAEYDIALIKIDTFRFCGVKTIPICDKFYFHHTIGLCGMGTLQDGGNYSEVLQEMRFHEAIDFPACPVYSGIINNTYEMENWSFDNRICLVPQEGHGPCWGDSGSPTFPMDYEGNPICLYGLVSWGPPNCTAFSVHTRVQVYVDWIKANIIN
ncbi:trypsin-1-like isoform X1 [Convolutriloba macropyga]|uniref:trypsin-1-like isoform X1 n=1 Tax=Convolutriloba macropyga TaxID=536237 RepID=UPI003F51FC55